VKIEVYHNGKRVNQVELDIPTENTCQGYNIRKAMIELEVQRLQKVYPLGDIWLSFESKINDPVRWCYELSKEPII